MADDVPETIKEILTSTGMTQTKLAKRAGVSQSTVNRWLNGKGTPGKDEWDRVQRILKEIRGTKDSLDEKIAPYGAQTQRMIHDVVDNILKGLPPPRR